MYLTGPQTSNVKMKAQFILACIMFFIGIAGFSTLLTLGLVYKFGIVSVCTMMFFYVVAIVGLVFVVKDHEEPEQETSVV